MFITVIFLLIAVMAGMAIDLARHETARADLQNALDRGVLAAANLNENVTNKATAETVIRSYMASRTDRSSGFALKVDEPVMDVGRQVTASLDASVPTVFLSAIGVDSLQLPASAGAAEARGLTEIVLVLDISGSMGEASTAVAGNTKLDDLKAAVKSFVDTVLTAENAGRTLISVVPYSAQVSLPASMAALYNIDREHNYSTCIDYSDLDYSTTEISTTESLDQSQHFADFVSFSYYFGIYHPSFIVPDSGTILNFNCPGASSAIIPFETDAQTLKDKVDAMQPQNWTASSVGMKWAGTLLDPIMRDYVTAKVDATTLSAEFAGWPR
ncbi:MAG: Tad domain-containing protein, partial [Pseudomonadota bacterium]